MGLGNEVVEGCTKKIVKASPMDVSKFRKKYLRSLSPGNNALGSFVQQTNYSCRLPKLVYNILARRLSASRDNRRVESIQMSQRVQKGRATVQKSNRRKIVFKESLRLNNL